MRLVVLTSLCNLGVVVAFSASKHAWASIVATRVRPLESPIRLKSVGSEIDVSPDGVKRRKLLFSMLAAGTGSAVLTPPSPSHAEGGQDTTAVPSIDWENIGEIMKPPLDDRDYMAYRMPNGLRVILCSDPLSNEAGAAMDVHVGACSDPKEIPGLAHFNEHMLFLGTRDYPKEDSFEEFLSASGGSSNAYTASEDTVYHFTLQAEEDGKLLEGLKRFGSFFTSPLFTESATGRELNAIESENAKNLQSDSFRLYQLEKGRQNSDHPHSKFFTGNKQTLLEDSKKKGLNLRDELIKFYAQYYSSNQMTLAVVGPQSLDELKKMVDSAFSNIPNRYAPPPESAWVRRIAPFGENSLIPSFGHIVKVVPVQDLRQVTVTFPIIYTSEQDRRDSLLTKQGNYVGHLIGHEGPYSLLSCLKEKGWANSLSAGSNTELADFETFDVTVGLTKKGLDDFVKVIEILFSYLSLMRDKGIPAYVFNEVLNLEELSWRFSSKGGVSGHVQSLSTSLQKYPPTLAVAGPRRLALARDSGTLETSSRPRTSFPGEQLDLTSTLTQDFVHNLTPYNALITVMSKVSRIDNFDISTTSSDLTIQSFATIRYKPL